MPKDLREQLARGFAVTHDALKDKVLPAGEVAGLAIDVIRHGEGESIEGQLAGGTAVLIKKGEALGVHVLR